MTRPMDWVFAARDAQLPPSDLSWCWLFLGGRGAGKSHSMSAAVHTAVRAGISRIHFIAPTTSDFHDVNIEGKSGIFATCGRDPQPRWVSSRRRLEWPNGAMCVFFSGGAGIIAQAASGNVSLRRAPPCVMQALGEDIGV